MKVSQSTPMPRGMTVLVTGAARRVGAAMARRFHAEGFNVAIHYRRSSEEADKLAAELNRHRPGSAITLGADLLQVDQLEGLIHETLEAFSRLDLLINNASSFYPTPVGQIRQADWDDLMGSNLKAPLFLSQAAAAALRQTGGSIINIVDVHALRPLKDHPVYSVAKAGLAMLTQSLARELGPEIRVNGVAPGAVIWPEDITPERRRHILERTALKRPGSPEDVAETALFLALRAPYITGQIINVDGGRSLTT